MAGPNTYFDQEKLEPIIRPELEIRKSGVLPVGGVHLVGGVILKGTLLGWVSGAARNHVNTITIDGAAQPTGAKTTITWYGDRVYQGITANLVTTIPTAAEMQTALEAIHGVGNVTVARTGTGPWAYAVTYTGILANRLIGGLYTVSSTYTAGTTPTTTIAYTTPGRAGAGAQLDVYASGNSNGSENPRAVNCYNTLTNSVGGNALVDQRGGIQQPYNSPVAIDGYYKCSQLTGLDATAITNGLGKIVSGTAVTDAEGWIHVGV